jgi:hypothetical protein
MHSTMAYIHEHLERAHEMGLFKSLLNNQAGKCYHSSHKTLAGNPHLCTKEPLAQLIYFLQPPLYFSILSLLLHIIYGLFYYYRSMTLRQAELRLERLLNTSPIHIFAHHDHPHLSSWITSEYCVLRQL